MMKDVGFRMKRGSSGLKDAQFESISQVEQLDQCIRIGCVEIITGDDADATLAVKEIPEVFAEQSDAAFQYEGHGEVGPRGLIQGLANVGQQWIILAADQATPMRE